MTDFDYSAIATEAAGVLAEFGAPLTLRTVQGGTYNPATGAISAASVVDVVRNGIVVDYSPGVQYGSGGLIQEGDRRCILEVGTEPQVKDRLVGPDGVVYQIVGVTKIAPAGVVVVYDLHVRA